MDLLALGRGGEYCEKATNMEEKGPEVKLRRPPSLCLMTEVLMYWLHRDSSRGGETTAH